MAADESLRTILLGVTAITDIVGATGVYLDDAGQADLSAYVIISQQSHDPLGDVTQTSGTGVTDFDIDCFAKSRTQARIIADAVTNYIKDYSGTSGSTTIDSVNWVDEGSDIVTANDGSSVNYYVFTESIRLFWSE